MFRCRVAYRIAQMKDADLINEMEEQCFRMHDRLNIKHIHRFISNCNPRFISDLILYNDLTVGWAAFFIKDKSIRIYSLCILPAFRGKGIGSIYLKNRLLTFQSQSEVTLEVRAGNRGAIRFYESLGFLCERRIPAYYTDGEDGLKMRLCLLPREAEDDKVIMPYHFGAGGAHTAQP